MLSLKDVPTVKSMRKNFESHCQKEQGQHPEPDPKNVSKDPDPYQNVTDPEHCL
jgi:hypothetical protein